MAFVGSLGHTTGKSSVTYSVNSPGSTKSQLGTVLGSLQNQYWLSLISYCILC
jgi:hypothetical protein